MIKIRAEINQMEIKKKTQRIKGTKKLPFGQTSWEGEMEGCVSNITVCNLAYSGKLDELKESILADKSLATRTDQDSRALLHWACSAGHKEIVEFLLQLGVPVNDKDDASWSPFHIAASAGRDEIVKYLLVKGAHVSAINKNGCTPLHYAASKNRHEVTVMHWAAAKGNLKMVHILLYYKASTNIQDIEDNTPLHLACDEERMEETKLLVTQGSSIYIENKEEKTSLQVAKGGLSLIFKRMVES